MSSTHSCLIQLNHIGYRLTWVNLFLDKLVVNLPDEIFTDSEQMNEIKKHEAQLRIFLDYIFLNLYQLLEIHDNQIGKMLKDLNSLDIEKSLCDLWLPIKQMRNKIELWRHGYVTHSKSQALNYQSFQEINPNYLDTIKKMFHASRCAVFYISGIFTNLQTDYKAAITNQKIKINNQEIQWSEFKRFWKQMQEDSNKLLIQSNSTLKSNGRYDFDPLKYLGQ